MIFFRIDLKTPQFVIHSPLIQIKKINRTSNIYKKKCMEENQHILFSCLKQNNVSETMFYTYHPMTISMGMRVPSVVFDEVVYTMSFLGT